MTELSDPLPLAQALIRCQSVTPADDGAIGLVQDALSALGFTAQRLSFGAAEGRPPIENLYASRGDQGDNFCFAGHTDVVPVGRGWSVDPFAAEIIEGKLFGRGAADMKGAIACFIAAVARLGPDHPFRLSLLITGDEEGPGQDGTQRMLDHLTSRDERIDACLVGEPTNPRLLGEMIKIGRRGSLNGELTVLGSQGHAAYPHLADNPLPRLLRMLQLLVETQLDEGSAHFQPSTITLTSIDVGNPASNVIPARGSAKFNIRFNDLHSGASLSDWLRRSFAAIGGAYELQLTVSGESFLTPAGPLSHKLARAITRVTGIEPELSTSGGTSDARFIKNFCPVVEFGLVGQSMHKADEHVALADLEKLTLIYLDLLRDFRAP